jgi:galactose mutarotase-like enzyme
LLKLDQNGLPIHGAIAGALPWELLERPGADADQVHARLAWRSAELLAIFPFAHSVELEARIESESTLVIETSVCADESTETSVAGAATSGAGPETPAAPMPVSFGYHPYLKLPDGDRSQWTVELPMRRRLLLGERMIPTGASEALKPRCFQLADDSWDDAFGGLLDPPTFSVSSAVQPRDGDGAGVEVGAGAAVRRIALELRRGYAYAQLYAPAGEDFVCFEPMTGPTNALVSREGLPLLAPGERFQTAFAVTVHA